MKHSILLLIFLIYKGKHFHFTSIVLFAIIMCDEIRTLPSLIVAFFEIFLCEVHKQYTLAHLLLLRLFLMLLLLPEMSLDVHSRNLIVCSLVWTVIWAVRQPPKNFEI